MVILLAWLIAVPLLGFLTGCRSMTPMAVLCWFAYAHHLGVHHNWAFWVAMPVTAIVFTVFALGELVVDKLPKCPNRTDPGPLVARLVFGGLVGAIVAMAGLHGSWLEGAILGAIGALAGTFIGFQIRRHLVKDKGRSDLSAALLEDGLVIVLSILALRFITA